MYIYGVGIETVSKFYSSNSSRVPKGREVGFTNPKYLLYFTRWILARCVQHIEGECNIQEIIHSFSWDLETTSLLQSGGGRSGDQYTTNGTSIANRATVATPFMIVSPERTSGWSCGRIVSPQLATPASFQWPLLAVLGYIFAMCKRCWDYKSIY